MFSLRSNGSHRYAFRFRSGLRSARQASLSLARLARFALRWAGEDSALAVLTRSGRLGPAEGRLPSPSGARRHPLAEARS